jgi:hypothetical protein
MSVLKHLDLASVFKKEKPAALPSEIIGVITMKGDGFDSIKSKIEDAGFLVSKEAVMEDDSVLFGQSEDMTGEHVLIRLSENAVVAVKRFNPYNMDMGVTGDSTFAEVCKAQGFYPGVGTMVDVLRSSVLTLAEKADDSAAAAVQVGKMFDEAKQYAMTMVSALPSKAFKLEDLYPEEAVVEKAAPAVIKCKSCGADCKAGDKTCADCGADPMAAPAQKDEAVDKGCAPKKPAAKGMEDAADSAADAAGTSADGNSDDKAKPKAKAKKADGTDEDATEPLTQEVVAEMVSKQLEVFTAKMENLLGGVSKAVEGVGSSVQALTARVETAEGVAKAASEAVSGTVVLGSDGGDPTVVTQKSESRSFGREIDTAYLPRNQRNSAGRR